MNQLLFLIVILNSTALFSMQTDPAEHIKKQIYQFKAEGASAQKIADLSTDVLSRMLEYPLFHTPLLPYIDLYKTLIEAGGNKDVRHPKNGKTALQFAALDGRADIVKELMNLGLDHRIKDNESLMLTDILRSPLSLMNKSDTDEILELIARSKVS